MAEINYFPLGRLGGATDPVFFTADFTLVTARRIALLADDLDCDVAAERAPDIDFAIVIPC